MKLLITGNLGYIGTELVVLAKNKGHFVKGFDSGYFKDNLLSDLQAQVDQQILKDIRKVSADDFDGVDAVIHLAALSNDPICELDENITYEINYKASVQAAKLAKSKGVKRFVFASSASVYGIASEVVSEKSAVNPLTAYAKSKLLAEQELFALADDNFIVCAFRPATAYGLGSRQRTDIVLNNLCAWAHCEKKIVIMSDGSPLRPAAHVADIASAFLAAAGCPAELMQRQVFNLGRNEDNYSIRQMAEMVQAASPECDLVFTGEHSDSRSYAICFDKLHQTLGSYADINTSMLKGIEELIAGYSKYQMQAADFKDGRYARLPSLKALMNKGAIDSQLYSIS